MDRWKVEGVEVSRPRWESWISCCEENLLLGIVVPHQLLQPQLAGVEHAGHPVDQLLTQLVLPLLLLLLLHGLVNQHTSRLARKDGHLCRL